MPATKRFRFTAISLNKKTGPIPTTMTWKNSCPPTCPFRGNGCYAEGGPTNLWWDKPNLDKGEFLGYVKKIRRGTFWRHDVAGDLIHKDGLIDESFLSDLVAANKGKRGFTYTHHLPYKGKNLELIRKANDDGFTINLSANTEAEAVEYKKLGVPVCLVVPSTTTENFKIDGEQVLICPATKTGKSITCADCQLCQKVNRNCIVGFPSHGTGKKKVDTLLNLS